MTQSSHQLLFSNEHLVYIRSSEKFAETDGMVYIAKVIKDFIENDILWFKVQLMINAEGKPNLDKTHVLIRGDDVISNRSYHDIQPRHMYHFASLTFSDNIEFPIKASDFVITKNTQKPLSSTTRNGLGSGIYGVYIKNPDDIERMKSSPEQTVYEIECPDAYILQDKEHGDSITVASLHTNRYLEEIIQFARFNLNKSYEDILQFIRSEPIDHLVTLWNIVFYRTMEHINKNILESILAEYVVKYFTDDSIIDSINGDILQEQPINFIMRELGHDSIIANDVYNNGWNRGCVNYNYTYADIIQSGNAPY